MLYVYEYGYTRTNTVIHDVYMRSRGAAPRVTGLQPSAEPQ